MVDTAQPLHWYSPFTALCIIAIDLVLINFTYGISVPLYIFRLTVRLSLSSIPSQLTSNSQIIQSPVYLAPSAGNSTCFTF
ncbi:hypothetical protein C8F04DRAFT_1105759, partial [Mycena alexandri]